MLNARRIVGNFYYARKIITKKKRKQKIKKKKINTKIKIIKKKNRKN